MSASWFSFVQTLFLRSHLERAVSLILPNDAEESREPGVSSWFSVLLPPSLIFCPFPDSIPPGFFFFNIDQCWGWGESAQREGLGVSAGVWIQVQAGSGEWLGGHGESSLRRD